MAKVSEKRVKAEATLPPELRDTFDQLIADYQAAAERHTTMKWVNYDILADLVRDGWGKVS